MNQFELVTLKSGVKSLRSLERKETFHPGVGPSVEARILHVEQQRLVERILAASALGQKFVIWDVGFGAGANILTALEAIRNLDTPIELHSFDRTIAPIEFALQHADELSYLRGHELLVGKLVSEGTVTITPQIQWTLHLGDFAEMISNHSSDTPLLPSPHSILYDPYSPTGNPDMWTLGHFKGLRQTLSEGIPCLWTNYTRSTSVRVALLLAGFYVGVGCSIHEKAETTLASNRLELLDAPLTRKWLERVKISGNAAPLRSAHYSQCAISAEDFQALQSLRQFQAT